VTPRVCFAVNCDSELDLCELVGFVVNATPLSRQHALGLDRQGRSQSLVIALLGARSRSAAARDGVAIVASGGGHPDVALCFTRELAPRAVMGLRASREPFEVCNELLAFMRQSRECLGTPRVHERGLVAERALVVHAGANQLPKNVGGGHGRGDA
jgi:hypothetical protein